MTQRQKLLQVISPMGYVRDRKKWLIPLLLSQFWESSFGCSCIFFCKIHLYWSFTAHSSVQNKAVANVGEGGSRHSGHYIELQNSPEQRQHNIIFTYTANIKQVQACATNNIQCCKVHNLCNCVLFITQSMSLEIDPPPLTRCFKGVGFPVGQPTGPGKKKPPWILRNHNPGCVSRCISQF